MCDASAYTGLYGGMWSRAGGDRSATRRNSVRIPRCRPTRVSRFPHDARVSRCAHDARVAATHLKPTSHLTWGPQPSTLRTTPGHCSRPCGCLHPNGEGGLALARNPQEERPHPPLPPHVHTSASIIVIIINFLFVALTCNAETWNGAIKSTSTYRCH